MCGTLATAARPRSEATGDGVRARVPATVTLTVAPFDAGTQVTAFLVDPTGLQITGITVETDGSAPGPEASVRTT